MKKLFLLAIAIVFASCQKNDVNKYDSSDRVVSSLDASSFSTWTYFSFRQGKIVEVSDFKTSAEWDIAFHRGDVRLNGGASRSAGKVGYYLTDKENLSEVTEVPSGIEYTFDTEKSITTSYNGHGNMTQENQPASPMNWTHMRVTQTGPAYDIEKKVFIIRMEDGGVVKLKFTSYLNDTGKGGFISFKYNFLVK